MWRKLQRNLKHRWVGGVCSGFARFIGLDNFPVRLLIRFLFVSFVPMFWWVYLILWILLPAQKLYETEEVTAKERPKSVYRPQVRVEVRRLEFDDVVEMTRGKVSERVFQKVTVIDASVRALLPQLSWWRSLIRPEFGVVKRSALEYFPQALQHYLTLPRDYAENHRLMDGRTPEEKLLADLGLLENTLKNVLESVYNNEKASVPSDLKRLGERLGMNDPPSDDIGRTLDQLVARIRGRVPEEILDKVVSLRAAITSVVPQISEMGAGTTREAYNVRQTALEYLPDALEKYLSLPEGFAETHILANGKTAKGTLLEQLELLDATMKDMIGDVYQEDAEALLIHGRFLKEKFADKFTLPADEGMVKFPNPEPLKVPKRVPDKEKVRLES